jgi:hypothetical protein
MVESLRGKAKREEGNPGKIKMKTPIKDRGFKVKDGWTMNFKILMKLITIIGIKLIIKIIKKIIKLSKMVGIKFRYKKFKNKKILSLNFRAIFF